MPLSPALTARRALVRVLQFLAQQYQVTLRVTRDSCDKEVTKAFKKVAAKVHPDKGGSTKHTQELIAAKEAWDKAKEVGPVGRPEQGGRGASAASNSDLSLMVRPEDFEHEPQKVYRVRSSAVLLTYFGFQGPAHWKAFVAYLRASVKKWKVRHWCTTLEVTKAGRLHVHLMLQFVRAVDCPSRTFAFDKLVPRADPCDLLGEGYCKRKLQASVDRGMFYCWADKLGTQRDEYGEQCRDANYEPCWTEAVFSYSVSSRWPENLWKARKLSTETYEQYLYLTRDAVPFRKRNLDTCKEREAALASQKEIEERVKRIRANHSVYRPFPAVPEALAWLSCFKEDRLRYPLLVVVGPSSTGKTEWAKSLFTRPLELTVGALEHFPDGVRTFARGHHDGLVLDDLRDFAFLVKHQEKLQGKYDRLVEFASTPGGQLAHTKDLFALPVVVTANNDSENLQLLETSDWLGCADNRVLLQWPPAAAKRSRAGN